MLQLELPTMAMIKEILLMFHQDNKRDHVSNLQRYVAGPNKQPTGKEQIESH